MFTIVTSITGQAGGLTSKEEEDTPLHAAEHGHEALANDEGEEHVHGHIEGACGCANLQRLDLTAHTINKCQCSIQQWEAYRTCLVHKVQCMLRDTPENVGSQA